MRTRSLTAIFLSLGTCVLLFAGLDARPEADESPAPAPRRADAPPPRVLPGLLADGGVQLPNQWQLRPAGKQIDVGDFPVNAALHPSGQYLAVLHAGMKDHEVIIIDLNKTKPKIVCRVSIDQTFYGLCFAPDGRKIYASGGEFEVIHEFDFSRGLIGARRTINLAGTADGLVVGGLAMDPAGRDLFACCTWGDAIVRIPVDNPATRRALRLSNVTR